MAHRPGSSPSPSPGPFENGRASARQSMGPSARGTPTLAPPSPRPGPGSGARPTSELLGTGAMAFQTPEAEALDQWFENLQNYEATLEEMAAASLDANFKEELSAIEQWFKVLSEAERTAALYSLLQHSTQVQIRFFITVLQQMARSDPMTALLSPAMGSMQSQMESRLASIKSPGLRSGLPSSPTTHSFNRQSVPPESIHRSPEPPAVNIVAAQNEAAAATLAQQRARLKASSASHASHRISAPPLASSSGDPRGSWGPSQLSQVNESQSSADDARPKSMDVSAALGTPKLTADSNTSDSWASMVTTPLVPMFKKDPRPANLEVPSNTGSNANKGDWSMPPPGVPRMGDPTIHRRNAKNPPNNNQSNNNHSGVIYDDNGNPIQQQNHGQQGRPVGLRGNNGGWTGARPPPLGSVPSNDSNNQGGNNLNGAGGGSGHNTPMPNNPMNGLGMQMPGGPGAFGMTNLGSPTLGMGMPGMGMSPLAPFNMNMLGMMTPEAQLLAAQMAASGVYNPALFGMQPLSAGLGSAGLNGPGSGRPGGGRGGMMGGLTPNSARSPGPKSAASSMSRHDGNSTPKGEEDVNPELLKDIPAWLRSLRLHKYTPNFEGAKWQDMVMMDEAALEAKGVAALGARRKMLKTFELVRKKMGMEDPPASAGVATPATATSGAGA